MMLDKATPTCDLSNLSEANQAVVHICAEGIRDLARNNVQNIIDIGSYLLRVKDILGHGQFGPWLAAEFKWSNSTATKMMQVHQRFGASTIDLSRYSIAVSALYRLSSPSVSYSAVAQVFDSAIEDEMITLRFVDNIIRNHEPGGVADNAPEPSHAVADYDSCPLQPVVEMQFQEDESTSDPDIHCSIKCRGSKADVKLVLTQVLLNQRFFDSVLNQARNLSLVNSNS